VIKISVVIRGKTMVSFFDKLRKGMGADNNPQKELPQDQPEKIGEADGKEMADEKPKKQKLKRRPEAAKSIKVDLEEPNNAATEESLPNQSEKRAIGKKKEWASIAGEAEGQLAVDVYQTENDLVIQSAIAGVRPESLDILIEGDMVTIRGAREKPEETGEKNYFYQECFWGPFSRQIILSVEVDPSRTEALLKEGILTVRIPKIERERKRKIIVRGQN
jgi:HSP20 family protein